MSSMVNMTVCRKVFVTVFTTVVLVRLVKSTQPIDSTSWRWDSNSRPADYKSAALPTELRQR